MNIFILDHDIHNIPKNLVDKHLNAQIKEGAQMLSAPFWINNKPNAQELYESGIIYKISHEHHPCTRWTCFSIDNWFWLKRLVELTHEERMFRFPNRTAHKSYLLAMNMPVPRSLPLYGLTRFAQAMPNEYKHNDPVVAYRCYYSARKQHLFNWTHRQPPLWIPNLSSQW